MIIAIIFLAFMFMILLLVSLKQKGWEKTGKALTGGYRVLVGLIPLLFLAFLTAGFLEVTVPPDLIKGWLGVSSGSKGYLISLLTGSLLFLAADDAFSSDMIKPGDD